MKLLYIIPLFLLGFLLVHALKMMRFYLVLLEEKLSLKTFIPLYIRTTFVNILIPFKLGEIYRAFCVVRLTKCLEIGIISVILDRFFDTFSLLLFLVPYELIRGQGLTWITGLLLVFLALVLLVYRMFEPTYTYLNRYLIKKSRSRRGIAMLGILEKLREWYDYTRKLVTGRQYLIVICSACGWLAEVLLLKLIAMYKSLPFGLQAFAAYIYSIFGSGSRVLLTVYSAVSLILLALLILGISIARLLRRTGSRSTQR